MFRLNFAIIRRTLVKAAMVVGIVALTVLAMRVFGPRQTAAQPAQEGDVRATSFTLVGADGTVLAKLAPSSAGNGILTLFDTAGRPRAAINGNGAMAVLDTNGKPRIQLAYAADGPFAGLGAVTVADTDGKPRIQLAYNAAGPTPGLGGMFVYDANGTARTVAGYNATDAAPFVRLYGENGPEGPTTAPCGARAALHLRDDASYGLDVCDADGNLIYTAP
jgi:hypothetical protein